jgi:hypothetical protein
MFQVVRVFENEDEAKFRAIRTNIETKAEARKLRDKFQYRFPQYLFWVKEA